MLPSQLLFPDHINEKGGGLVPHGLQKSLQGCRGAPSLASGLSFLSAKHHLQGGLEPLGRMGLLAWDHGWVSLCLTHSCLPTLSSGAASTQGNKRRIPLSWSLWQQ